MHGKIAASMSLALGLILAALPPGTVWAAERLGSYAIDPGAISISGISSGGFMANQFHVAHSATIMGAGIVAGGPYACARVNAGFGDYLGNYKKLWNAVYVCSHQAGAIPVFGVIQPFLGPPDPDRSVAATRANAESGAIDAVDNMRDDRVWLFSGAKDTLVPPSVMDALHAYYTEIFGTFMDTPEKSILYVNRVDAHHAMIVARPGDNNCLDFELPYINDCDYDAAGTMLRFFYRRPEATLNPPMDWNRQSLIAFDQTEFFPEGTGRGDGGDGSISMNDIGHVYVPESCRAGATCRLHVALHGCEQYQERIEQECGREGRCPPHLFFESAGYNEWAEANDIIVLYPQTIAWDGPSLDRTNPKGCWDWWGFTGDGYATKNGKQIRAIKGMIDRLLGGSTTVVRPAAR